MSDTNNPYNPFPSDMKADRSVFGNWRNATCCETETGGSSVRFIFIYAHEYINSSEELDRRQRLLDAGYEYEEVYPEVTWLGYLPDMEDTFWIYEVEVDIIDKEYLQTNDSEVFTDNARQVETVFFDRFDSCMNYIRSKYNVEPSDFQKISSTNYPKC